MTKTGWLKAVDCHGRKLNLLLIVPTETDGDTRPDRGVVYAPGGKVVPISKTQYRNMDTGEIYTLDVG